MSESDKQLAITLVATFVITVVAGLVVEFLKMNVINYSTDERAVAKSI